MLVVVIFIFIIPLITMVFVNIPYISYFTEEEVQTMKYEMNYFTNSHKHPESGLFIEPDIDTNYRVFDSINWSTFNISLTNLTDPRSNPYVSEKPNFFFDYLFDKQNQDGSFSDVSGFSNIFSTYEVVQIINRLNHSFINADQKQEEINQIINYINNSLEENGSGFKANQYSSETDIISTFAAIELAYNFSAYSIILNNSNNISSFINSLFLAGGYRLSNISFTRTPESTYYGIKAFLAMNLSYSMPEKILINSYLSSHYDPINGGFSSFPGNASDVRSTFYALSSFDTLNLTPFAYDENATLIFLLNCSKPDKGFGINKNITYSDFTSGWAAMKAISLIEKNGVFNQTIINKINQTRINYYTWLYNYQAKNGLFGEVTIESNYWGVLTAYQLYSTEFTNYIDVNNILDYVNSCYVRYDGSYASTPNLNSSLFSSYCAINIYKMLEPHTDTWLHNESATINYLLSLQNSDGGFKVGNDLEVVFSMLGTASYIIKELINTNISISASTYWALISLDNLGARNQIDLENLTHWVRSCQNADGGFGLFLGFSHSDIISTYYALHVFKLFNDEPMSKISAISFLKNAQTSDGSFTPMPTLSMLGISASYFIISYMGAMGLYDFAYQAEDIQGFLTWYTYCIDPKTGGVGDTPGFGGDLRNTPYGFIIIDNLRYDRAFDPDPWNTLLITIILVELGAIGLFGLFKLTSYLNLVLLKKIKESLELGEKLDITKLRKFPAINCEDLCIYAGGKLIVDSMTLKLEHGEILGVLGESRAGKSTFVKSLLGMRKFTGISQIYGMDVKKKSKKMRPIYGYVPQDLSKIYLNFTTLQNIMYFGKQYGLTEKEIRRKAKRILRSLEIEDKTNEFVRNLSGGQKRRVSIAIGLIHDPVIVWMDEPTSGLDPVVRENLWHALTKINDQFNTTLIVITHYPEESRFCNKVAIFGRNRGLVDYGRPKDLLGQLPGKGRTISLIFKEVQENPVKRLEAIDGIDKALENKAGIEFGVLSNINIYSLQRKIEIEFGLKSIQSFKQSESQMEEYFRFKAMEVPKIDEE